jgi:pimeloyl-ACP methyl ester carboxylesterase
MDRPHVDDYAPYFKQLPKGTVVCGFSLGAIVAAHYANRMKADALILFGLNPFADDPDRAPARHALADDVTRQGGAAALRSRNLAVHGPHPTQAHDDILRMADRTAPMIAAQTHLALTRPGALAALRKARIPVLSLTGSQDISAPVVQGKAAADAAPKGQFHLLNGLGHFALLEDPKACATGLKDMLQGA